MRTSAALLLLALASTLGAQAPARFPEVRSETLEGKNVTLPRDFAGRRNILFIAFERKQQDDVDTWVPFVKQTLASHADVDYYELPTIKKMIGLMKWTINKGMAGGIADKTAREHTLTLYLDKAPFKQALGITDERVIHILVVDREGVVLWRTTGRFSPEVGAQLAQALSR
jgi:hypothetical protein